MDDVRRSAGVPPAVAGASRPRFGSVTIRDRGHLPHWELEGGLYFVTFRLHDALPNTVLESILGEQREIVERSAGRARTASEDRKLDQITSARIQKYLDNGAGSCYLREAAIAELVVSALQQFDGQRYRLEAWCVMPNHVHVLFRCYPNHSLAPIVQSWKSFTAKRANRLLGRTGAFWQREYYDRLVRTSEEYSRVRRYICTNPDKANLQNWKWVWVGGQDAHPTAGGTPALR